MVSKTKIAEEEEEKTDKSAEIERVLSLALLRTKCANQNAPNLRKEIFKQRDNACGDSALYNAAINKQTGLCCQRTPEFRVIIINENSLRLFPPFHISQCFRVQLIIYMALKGR